jgi:hypothetical protein
MHLTRAAWQKKCTSSRILGIFPKSYDTSEGHHLKPCSSYFFSGKGIETNHIAHNYKEYISCKETKTGLRTLRREQTKHICMSNNIEYLKVAFTHTNFNDETYIETKFKY